ncbi:MAG: hypothetical protein GXY52_11210 [Chloroflexi bacterium]|nr:hypothetical protein [Chloroflexota bacterium]
MRDDVLVEITARDYNSAYPQVHTTLDDESRIRTETMSETIASRPVSGSRSLVVQVRRLRTARADHG